MNASRFEKVLKAGESTTVEFKKCSGRPEDDTYETICSFANHAGGNIYLGVMDDGSVVGAAKAADTIFNRI